MSSENQPSPEIQFAHDLVNGLAIAVNILIQKLEQDGTLSMNEFLDELRQQHSGLLAQNQKTTAHGVNLLLGSLEYVTTTKSDQTKQAH
ncbi:hypothetical protein FP037_003759 [Escherichia coli]|nr:hypothetical protein [Escherichia coli]